MLNWLLNVAGGLWLELFGPILEEVSQFWDACFGRGQVLVAEAGQAREHLREYALFEARVDPGGLVQEVTLGEVF